MAIWLWLHDILDIEPGHIGEKWSHYHWVLAKLFSHMLTHPLSRAQEKESRYGTIITVYKGGKKDKRNPNSFHAITLIVWKGLFTSPWKQY